MPDNNFEDQVLGWVQKKKRIDGLFSTNTQLEPLVKGSEFEKILTHLECFGDNFAYLNSRRLKGSVMTINSEADVQDLLFVMLKPSFPTLTFEDPGAKAAASFAIKDLYFPLSKTVLEAKYVYESKDVKSVEKQLHDDIMKYSANLDCEAIIFFIFDPNFSLSDRRTFVQKMTQTKGQFMRDGREITITTIIRPE
ncbi:MAG: hypothetical protein AAB467_04195 [Patescibacteria group bacterium]